MEQQEEFCAGLYPLQDGDCAGSGDDAVVRRCVEAYNGIRLEHKLGLG